MKNTKRGFTLIELLVVIAIIGILSATVLAALGSARNKANDAKITGQLSQMRASAEMFATSNTAGTGYVGLCAVGSSDTSGMYALRQGSNYPGGSAPACGVNTAGTAWAAEKALISNTALFFCVDSLGQATTTTGSSITSGADSGDTKCGA